MLRQRLGVLALVAIMFGALAFMVIAGGKLGKKKQEGKLKEKDDKDKEGGQLNG